MRRRRKDSAKRYPAAGKFTLAFMQSDVKRREQKKTRNASQNAARKILIRELSALFELSVQTGFGGLNWEHACISLPYAVLEQLINSISFVVFPIPVLFGVVLMESSFKPLNVREQEESWMNVSDIWLAAASSCEFYSFFPRDSQNDCTWFFLWCLLLIALSNNNREGINISRARSQTRQTEHKTRRLPLCNIVSGLQRNKVVVLGPLSCESAARERFQSRRVVYCKLYCHLSHISVFYSSETNDSGVSSLGNANANVQAKWALWRLINFDGGPINLVDRMMPRSVGAQFTTLTLLTNMSVSSKCRPNIFGASPG